MKYKILCKLDIITRIAIHQRFFFIHFFIRSFQLFLEGNVFLEYMPSHGSVDFLVDFFRERLYEFVLLELQFYDLSDIPQYRFFPGIDKEHELISSKPASSVAFPNRFFKNGRYFLQYPVSCDMPERIIDSFKIVYIDIEDGIRMLLGYLIEVFAVIESGQRILIDFMGMFQFRPDNLIESPPLESLADHKDLSVIRTHVPK